MHVSGVLCHVSYVLCYAELTVLVLSAWLVKYVVKPVDVMELSASDVTAENAVKSTHTLLCITPQLCCGGCHAF